MGFSRWGGLWIFFLLSNAAIGQQYTQVLRGQVVDVETQSPLPGAVLRISRVFDDSVMAAAVTDAEGAYLIAEMPVGVYHISVQAAFFAPNIREDVAVVSTKETIIDFALSPSQISLDEVEVTANPFRGEALNHLASVSAVTITPEQTRKFAGSWDDPMRVITAYPGVVQQTSGFNDFSIRGNAPTGMLYRLEGVPIHNPNHFGQAGTAGGFVTQFSSELLSRSDFFSSAFPAEFGNATAAAFDFRFRSGNNERREHTVKASLFGLDLATEGPFSQNSKASYLANYRYSTLGILASFIDVGGVRPNYQDFSFLVDLPVKNGGTFKVFGIGGLSDLTVGQSGTDSTELSLDERRSRRQQGNNSGAIGVAYYQPTSGQSYLHAAVATSAAHYYDNAQFLEDDFTWSERDYSDYRMGQVYATVDYNHQFGNRHSNKTGIVFGHQQHTYGAGRYAIFLDGIDTLNETEGAGQHLQVFSQSKFDLTPRLSLNAGVNYLYFFLNGRSSVDPRVGLTYLWSSDKKLSLAYGHHSRIENLTVYYTQNPTGFEGQGLVNQDLELMKAHHGVLNYTQMITPSLKLSMEGYFQHQYNVPVEVGGLYTVQNLYGQLPNVALANTGIGQNYGMELLLHRFTKNGLYFMASASVFEARYDVGDGIWRNQEFNQGFSYNLLVGKEYSLKPKGDKDRIMGLNMNWRHSGGTWRNPIDLDESRLYGWTQYDWSNPNSVEQPQIYNLDFTFTWRTLRSKISGDFYVSIKNLYSNRAVINIEYDAVLDDIDTTLDYTTIPIIGYKVTF
ncbi:MAG TPA: hypothetical protein DCE41_34405 [Cytophagales bacterium]|nr:hypothetical protein [Cytophagales bacterium]HAA24164.1 hypothetical protein [Cytophagales bacterium]